MISYLFFYYGNSAHRNLHSFPTRRSSDLSRRKAFARSRWRLKAIRLSSRAGLCYECIADSSFFHRARVRSEEHTSELQSLAYLVCRLLLEKKKHTKSFFTKSVLNREWS